MLFVSVSMARSGGMVLLPRSVAKTRPSRDVSLSRTDLRAERIIETVPVPVPMSMLLASYVLLTVGCTQPNSTKLQGFDKSAFLAWPTTGDSVPDGGQCKRSTNHELNPIPLSQTF